MNYIKILFDNQFSTSSSLSYSYLKTSATRFIVGDEFVAPNGYFLILMMSRYLLIITVTATTTITYS